MKIEKMKIKRINKKKILFNYSTLNLFVACLVLMAFCLLYYFKIKAPLSSTIKSLLYFEKLFQNENIWYLIEEILLIWFFIFFSLHIVFLFLAIFRFRDLNTKFMWISLVTSPLLFTIFVFMPFVHKSLNQAKSRIVERSENDIKIKAIIDETKESKKLRGEDLEKMNNSEIKSEKEYIEEEIEQGKSTHNLTGRYDDLLNTENTFFDFDERKSLTKKDLERLQEVVQESEVRYNRILRDPNSKSIDLKNEAIKLNIAKLQSRSAQEMLKYNELKKINDKIVKKEFHSNQISEYKTKPSQTRFDFCTNEFQNTKYTPLINEIYREREEHKRQLEELRRDKQTFSNKIENDLKEMKDFMKKTYHQAPMNSIERQNSNDFDFGNHKAISNFNAERHSAQLSLAEIKNKIIEKKYELNKLGQVENPSFINEKIQVQRLRKMIEVKTMEINKIKTEFELRKLKTEVDEDSFKKNSNLGFENDYNSFRLSDLEYNRLKMQNDLAKIKMQLNEERNKSQIQSYANYPHIIDPQYYQNNNDIEINRMKMEMIKADAEKAKANAKIEYYKTQRIDLNNKNNNNFLINLTKPKLEAMTWWELKDLALSRGIKNAQKIKKNTLVKILLDK